MSPIVQQSDEIQMTPGLLRVPLGLGENAPGKGLPIAPFIQRLACRLDEAGISWVVLRNAEGLPDFTRYDVDLLTRLDSLPQCIRIIQGCAKETGWRLVGRIQKRHYTCLMLMQGTIDSGLFFLPLDLFTALEYRGTRYLDAEEVLKARVQTPTGIWTVPPGVDAAITLLKELFPHGVLKENSRDGVQTHAAANPEEFRRVLTSAVGTEMAAQLAESVQQGQWQLSSSEARCLRRAARRRTPGWGLAYIHVWAAAVAHLFRPSLGIVVCLAGADGSGKTTLAQGLVGQLFKRPFKAVRYRHGNVGVLPRFRDIRAFSRSLFQCGEMPPPPESEPETKRLKGMMTPIPAWKSMLLASYYALDLFLARFRLRRWRGQWSLILMDRSFYDYFVQLGHRNCPVWFLRLLSNLIPKPDLLFCIVGDAEQIHARKPELTVEEIQREQAILRDLSRQFPFGSLLNGEAGIDSMVEAGRLEILRRLFGGGEL